MACFDGGGVDATGGGVACFDGGGVDATGGGVACCVQAGVDAGAGVAGAIAAPCGFRLSLGTGGGGPCR